MAVAGPGRLLLGLLLLLSPLSSGAWDQDMELYDLVEEVDQNFYQLLSVPQDAPAADIKKAYRRLSLVLHPDKNKEADAEERFRQLVAVYEVLKDEERRKTYDDVLEHGLPDWKQPVFYYRRVRKMSNSELGIILFITLTVGHFAVLWSIYLEKQLDELLTRKKREKKKKVSSKPDADRDRYQCLAQERPHWQDLLPLKICIWLYVSLRNLPQTVQEVKCFYEEQQMMKRRLQEEEEEEEREHRPVRTRNTDHFPFTTPALDDGLHGNLQPGNGLHGYDAALEEIEDQMDDWLQEQRPKKKASDWSEEDLSLLSRLMVKFPGGTPGRWERIAHELNRGVAEVPDHRDVLLLITENCCSQTHGPSNFHLKLEVFSKGHAPCDITTGQTMTSRRERAWSVKRGGVSCEEAGPGEGKGRRQADFDPTPRKRRSLSQTRLLPSHRPAPWTQNQQRLLEAALQQFPRGTAERWTRIAGAVPGRSKDECMLRYKALAELVQKRKQTKTS
uniref:DnaJ (Hsp40) homolog, subfamily C, member 1 n=1 Tax=Neogobius melanostomus TaxID=47308 RepID=A0A8C6UNA5_9GOBI